MTVTIKRYRGRPYSSHYVIHMETGEIYFIKNVSKFCVHYGLSKSHFYSMLRGERQHAYGYQKYELQQEDKFTII